MEEIARELKEIEKTLARTNSSLDMLTSALSWLDLRDQRKREKDRETYLLLLAASVCVIIANIINIAAQLKR